MQPSLLIDSVPSGRRAPLPVALGSQTDIRYFGTEARGVLNGPETTGMGFWSLNPYVGCAFGCTYCYARYAHRYVMERTVAGGAEDVAARAFTELPPWLAFERRILVKQNAAAVLREQLQRERVRTAFFRNGETLVIGTATDPYQPAERVHRVTRSVLEVLSGERGLRLVIITKSPLVARDVDLLARLAVHSRVTIHCSLITRDRVLARRVEPRAPTPDSRLRAIRRLAEQGIDVGINVMPVLPGLTDRPDMLRALVREVAAAGASHVNACALRLQPTARDRYLPFIAAEFPHLAERYRTAYAEGYHMNDRYREGLKHFMERACREAGIAFGTLKRGTGDSPGSGGPWAREDEASAAHTADGAAVGEGAAEVAPQIELGL
jgi:DNA repair photolyase